MLMGKMDGGRKPKRAGDELDLGAILSRDILWICSMSCTLILVMAL